MDLPDGSQEHEELNAVDTTAAAAAAQKSQIIVALVNKRMRQLPALADTGSSRTLLSKSMLDDQALESLADTSIELVLPNGTMMKAKETMQTALQFVEFSQLLQFEWSCVDVNQLPYGMLIGRDLLEHLGLYLDFSNKTMKWDGLSAPMHPLETATTSSSRNDQIIAIIDTQEPSPFLESEHRQLEILDADYKAKPLIDYVPQHLSEDERKGILQLLESFESTLFSGRLGSWKGEPYEIPTAAQLKPFYSKPFPIPKSQEETT